MHLTDWNQHQSMMHLNALMLTLPMATSNDIAALLKDVASFNNTHYFNQLLLSNKCKKGNSK